MVPSTSAAGEIFSRDQPADAAGAARGAVEVAVWRDGAVAQPGATQERAASARRSKQQAAPTGDQAARSVRAPEPPAPEAPITAEKEVAPSLWKRLFGRSRGGDAAGEPPRPGGKHARKRRSRRRR